MSNQKERNDVKAKRATHRNVFSQRPKANRSSRGRHTWRLLLPRVALERMRRNAGYRDDSLLDDDSEFWLDSDSEISDVSLMKMNLVRPESLAREIPHVISRFNVDALELQEELPYVLNRLSKDAQEFQSQVVKAMDRASPTRDIQDMFDIEKVGPAGCIDTLDDFFGCSLNTIDNGQCRPMPRQCIPETDCDAMPGPMEMRIIRSDFDENADDDDNSSVGFNFFSSKKKKPEMRPKQRAHSLLSRKPASADGNPETRIFHSPIDDDTDDESLKMIKKTPRELNRSTSMPNKVGEAAADVSTTDQVHSTPVYSKNSEEPVIITDESTIVVLVELSEEKDCAGENEEDLRSGTIRSRISRVRSLFERRPSIAKLSGRQSGPVDVDLVSESWDSGDRSFQVVESNVGSTSRTIFGAAY